MKRSGLAVLAAVGFALAGTSSVFADEVGAYVGAGLGRAYIEVDDEVDFDGTQQKLNFEGDDFGFKVFGGYMFHENFGVELGYVDLGSQEDDFAFALSGVIPDGDPIPINVNGDIELEASGWTLAAVGSVPVERVDLFAKVGVIAWDADVAVNARASDGSSSFLFSDRDSDSGQDLMYGVGASMAFGDVAVRAEFEYYDIDSVDAAYLLTLGAVYRFPR